MSYIIIFLSYVAWGATIPMVYAHKESLEVTPPALEFISFKFIEDIWLKDG